jgi:hypothetical protein
MKTKGGQVQSNDIDAHSDPRRNLLEQIGPEKKNARRMPAGVEPNHKLT